MIKTSKNDQQRVTAMLTKSDLKVVDMVAKRAGISRKAALVQLLRVQLSAYRPTVH